MYERAVVSQKAAVDVLRDDVIEVGGRSYRVEDKYVNLYGDQALTLKSISHDRSTVKLTMPSDVIVTTLSLVLVNYKFED